MKLVEIIHGFETSEEVINTLREFCKKAGKDPVIVQDTTGFIVNRLLSAIRLLEMGTWYYCRHRPCDEVRRRASDGAVRPHRRGHEEVLRHGSGPGKGPSLSTV